MGTATTGLNVPGVSVAPPPIFAGAQAQGASDANRYATNMQGYGARMNAIGNIASAFSDKTLKENIVKVVNHLLDLIFMSGITYGVQNALEV